MSINDTSYNFTALTPGTNYTVSVAAVNMAGVREASTVTFYTITAAEAVPSGEFKFFINRQCMHDQFIWSLSKYLSGRLLNS